MVHNKVGAWAIPGGVGDSAVIRQISAMSTSGFDFIP